MKLLHLQLVMTALYLFDAASLPIVHAPFPFLTFPVLTLIYVVSCLEILGFWSLARWLRKLWSS